MTNPLEVATDPLESEDLIIKRGELKELIHFYYQTLRSFEALNEAAQEFKREHPDCYEYILFHDLIGSTPPEKVIKFDTPTHEIEQLILDMPEHIREKAA